MEDADLQVSMEDADLQVSTKDADLKVGATSARPASRPGQSGSKLPHSIALPFQQLRPQPGDYECHHQQY